MPIMPKRNFNALRVFANFLTVSLAMTLRLDNTLAQPPPDRASHSEKRTLVALEPLLHQAVKTFPNVKIESRNGSIIVSHQTRDFMVRSISGEAHREHGPGFSGFLLYLSVGQDVNLNYREEFHTQSWQETYWTTESSRYKLRVLVDDPRAGVEYPNVARGHWPYAALSKLHQAGLIPPRPGNGERSWPLTRYEFAVAVARLLDQCGGVLPAALLKDVASERDANAALQDLRREFASELARLGVTPAPLQGDTLSDGTMRKPRHEYIALNVSYGQGVNRKLLDAIKRTIAAYTEQVLKNPRASAEGRN